ADTLDEQLSLIEELQSHYEGELANPSSAFDVVSTRFTLDPNDERTWEDLHRLAGVTGRWENLADLWRGALSDQDTDTPGPAGRTAINELKITLAGVLREKLDLSEEAIQLYEEAVANADDPADCAEVLDLLEGLYEKGEQLEDLVRIRLLASEAALDGERRREKLLGACDILAGPLERPEDVLEHYEMLAAEDPSDVEYADRLESTYERLGRWAELTEHLEKRAEALRTPEATDRLHFRGAMIRYKHLGELDGAVEDLLKLIASEHVGDQVRQVLVDLCADPEAMSDALRSTVIDSLQAHYGEVGDPLGQAMLLEVQAAYSPPGMSRAHLLLEAAGHVLEAWNDDLAPSVKGQDLRIRAFDYYAEALREVPTSAVTLAALDELVQQLERWEPYADLMVEVAEACPEPAIAVGLRHRAALTIQQHLDNMERAVLAWESVLNSDRRHAGNYRSEALHALDSLYEKTDRRGARVKVLQQLAEIADRTMTR
ncbi:MAG: hypothetical protein VX938_04720, partial [Myxococcota bacterium]|nr:hypothetical protein [Myxococcota bacterium]